MLKLRPYSLLSSQEMKFEKLFLQFGSELCPVSYHMKE
jgi:hypothetical protein